MPFCRNILSAICLLFSRQGFVPAAYVKKIDPGLTASQQQLLDNSSVGARQSQIEKTFESVQTMGKERTKRLEETHKGKKHAFK